MSRHHLISGLAAAAALVITGAVFVFFEGKESPPAATLKPDLPRHEEKWKERPCPARLVELAASSAYNRRTQCGTLRVPQTEGEKRRSLEVSVIRLIPLAENAQKNPVLFLAGGPGDAFSQALDKRLPALSALAQGREILIVDQRGTGLGIPLLECRREIRTREHLDACFREWRADLDPRAYNTSESARDLARALDHHRIDQVAVYGVSYGTRVALAFAEMYPERTERILLDSPVAYRDVLAEVAKNSQLSLERVMAACQEGGVCGSKLQVSFQSLIETLESMDRKNPGSGKDFLFALSKLSLHPSVLPYVPYLVQRAGHGDTELLSELRAGFSTYQSSYGLHLSVQCAEFFAHTTPEAISRGEAQVSPFFRRAFSTASYQEQCAGWAVPPLPMPQAPKNLEVPVLVVSGAFDPVTPPEYGAALRTALPRSRHVTIQSAAHGAALTPCGALLGIGFMEGGLEAALPDCADDRVVFEAESPDAARRAQMVDEVRYRL